MNTIGYFVLIFIASFLSAFTLPFLKQYLETNNYFFLTLAIVFHFLLLVLYIKLLQVDSMTQTFAIIKVLSIIMIIIIGVLFFNEKVNRKILFGIVFAIVAIYLLNS